MDLIDVIHTILVQKGEAIHLLVLTQECVTLGLVPDDSKDSQRVIYNAVLGDIKRNGENSRFRRGGRAEFVASESYDPAKHIVTPNKTKCSEGRKYARKPTTVVEENRRCGNCKHIAWSGPGFFHQLGGGCNNQAASGLFYVKSDQQPCEHWRQRSEDQIAADQRERAKDLAEATKTNLTTKSRRRGE